MICYLQVSQDDIINGVPNSGEKCPIALALDRFFPEAIEILVEDGESIKILLPELNDYLIPIKYYKELQVFINRYDNLEAVEPFEMVFELELEEDEVGEEGY